MKILAVLICFVAAAVPTPTNDNTQKGLPAGTKTELTTVNGLFFTEHTLKVKMSDITIDPASEFLVLIYQNRLTKSNADITEHVYGGDYYYYYRVNCPEMKDEIVIFVRDANRPVWYGIAVGATVVFMVGVYLINKKKLGKRMNQN